MYGVDTSGIRALQLPRSLHLIQGSLDGQLLSGHLLQAVLQVLAFLPPRVVGFDELAVLFLQDRDAPPQYPHQRARLNGVVVRVSL